MAVSSSQYKPRQYSLDLLIDEEQEALAIWSQLVVKGMHQQPSPALKRLALAAWKSYCVLVDARRECERSWGL